MSGEWWASFDCYGTLVDWAQGIQGAIEVIAPGMGKRLAAAYHEIEPRVQEEAEFCSYRDVQSRTLELAAAREGVPLTTADLGTLSVTLRDWPVFTDVQGALNDLRDQGWRLAILSNIDRDLLFGTLDRIQVPIDQVVTAEDVRSYKPAPAHFLHFQRTSGVVNERWVHVARSYFHDIVPASRIGIASVWINRDGDGDDPALATVVLPDLVRLPEILAGMRARRTISSAS